MAVVEAVVEAVVAVTVPSVEGVLEVEDAE